MRITYVTHTRFPTEKAHGKQIAEVCYAMADIGHDVTLVCPRVRNTIVESPQEYYGLSENFQVRYLHHLDGSAQYWIPGILRFAVTMFFYRLALKKFLLSEPSDVLYVRSAQLIPLMVKLGKPVVAELHTIPSRNLKQFVAGLNACACIVCLTTPMRDALAALGVESHRMMVEGDGVLLSRFAHTDVVQEVRKRFGIPDGRKLVGYVGSLVTRNTIEKGVAELVQAIARLRKREYPVTGLVIGGPPSWKLTYIKLARSLGLEDADIVFHDRIPATEVPSVLNACDILVYPAPKTDHPYFQRDTSPLKLFEYLAAARPIVCADIPPVRDAVQEDVVTFAEPGNPESFAKGIAGYLKGRKDSERQKQQELAQWYSWQSRMQRILQRIESA